MTRYYISSPEGVDQEITEAEWLSLIGEEPVRDYAVKVYRGKMIIDDVPEEDREAVAEIVANKIARWGTYEDRRINSDELVSMIEGVL